MLWAMTLEELIAHQEKEIGQKFSEIDCDRCEQYEKGEYKGKYLYVNIDKDASRGMVMLCPSCWKPWKLYTEALGNHSTMVSEKPNYQI